MQPSAETIRLNKQMEKEIKNWIEGCRKGLRSAQRQLYERYARMLFASCYRILANTEEAEEAMQDAILKVLTRIGQYKLHIGHIIGQCVFVRVVHRFGDDLCADNFFRVC